MTQQLDYNRSPDTASVRKTAIRIGVIALGLFVLGPITSRLQLHFAVPTNPLISWQIIANITILTVKNTIGWGLCLWYLIITRKFQLGWLPRILLWLGLVLNSLSTAALILYTINLMSIM